MGQPIVFLDIAGPDDSKLRQFYSSIFGWAADRAGQSNVEIVSPIKGAFRKDPPENGYTLASRTSQRH